MNNRILLKWECKGCSKIIYKNNCKEPYPYNCECKKGFKLIK